MPTKTEKDAITGREDTGHEWDGIRELNTPLPRWWLYTFIATIIFAVGYMFLFPSVPWFTGYFHGVLGYSNRTALTKQLAVAGEQQKALQQRIAASSVQQIRQDPELFAFAEVGGRVAFDDNCAPCHRVGGAGAVGYPALAAGDWLWGGKLDDIEYTITHGIRADDPKTRQSAMPRFGIDHILTDQQISDVADYVISLSRRGEAPPDAIARGAKVFTENCVVCHGANGIGNRDIGAPHFANHLWLYGGDKASVVYTVTYARNSTMPAWGARLSPATIKMLTIYVHSLGGGQ
jgi:cytochrome c oxidase cbb3-type subunit III